MAQSFTTNSGITLKIPGTYVEQQVRANQGGIAAAGVVTLIGEADEGPGYLEEKSLDANGFAPDDIASVISKYGSGRLVDAFREIVAAAADPNIVGAVSLVKLVKTNPSTYAEAILARAGFGNYASVMARRAGMPGNLIQYQSAVSVPEVAPTTGLFSYVPHYSATPVAFSLRQNGSALDSFSIAQLTDGPAFAAAIEDLSTGTLAVGGVEKLPLTGKSGNISLAVVSAPNGIITISLPGLIDADQLPEVGDSLVIPLNGDFGASADSVLKGAANANRAAYIVTAVNNSSGTSTITAKRINTPSGAPSPAAVSATAITQVEEFICYSQVEVRNMTGMDRQATVGLSAVTLNCTSNTADGQIVMTINQPWAARPNVGDILKFTATTAGVTAGWYQVTASTDQSLTAQRLSNGTSGTTGTSNISGPIAQGSQPFYAYKPTIDGLGKSMEIVSGTSATIARNPQSTAAASWTSGNPLLTSASEYENAFTISRDTATDTFLSGGDIVASFSCEDESATMVIGATQIDFKIGATIEFSCKYKQFPTLKNIVDYVNSQPGFYAETKAAQFDLIASSSLDRGTFNLSASQPADNQPARIKRDASEFISNTSGSGLATTALEGAQSGLPEAVSPAQFLHGGTKAGSTSAAFVNAIGACEGVDTNFIVPLVSRDASEDILDDETESDSTYSIDAINAACKSHVIQMSALKARKNRMAIVSYKDTYDAVKQAAGQMASFRVGLTFQDVNVLGGDGTIQQFQPWMGAVVAAGMQSAAGYKGIVKKFANISGIVDPSGFQSGKPSSLEDALTAGLLILESVRTGGFRWVSDQLTYSVDNNFVYNSLQAVYIADLMALTLIQNFDLAVVGKSVAEISAAAALAFLDSQMFNFLRLRWIAPSDDAPRGYKNASVKLVGGVMQIYLEAKLAGLIYFVPIMFEISEVQQTAAQ